MTDENSHEIEVTLDSANGPKVVYGSDVDAEQVESALPDGWTVGDNWHLQVKTSDGRFAVPLVRTHGGWRHGLDEGKRAKPISVRLGTAALAALDELAGAHRLSRSEVVRRLLLGRPLDDHDDAVG